MQRRKFIEQSLLSAASLALLSNLLSSCKNEDLFGESTFSGEVIIVGAGAAGLYAAYLLNLHGIRVKILESSDHYGGRVKSLKDFADYTIELGAEEIHGERSIWHDMVLASGAKFISATTRDFYYFNGGLKTEIEANENTFFKVMMEMIDNIGVYTGGDITAEAYAHISGLSDNVSHIFNALVGNENGSSASRIGMFGLREAEEKWTSGNRNLMVKDKSLLEIMESRFGSILDKIVLQTRIVAIDYSQSKIVLRDENDTTYETDKVILTVPISILKDGDIEFTPALPIAKSNAFQKIGFDRGIKIVIRFDERVWPENTGSLFGNGYVPEFWPTSAGERSADDRILTAFVTGEKAEQLAALGSSIIPTILAELDILLGDVSSHYVSHVIQDWGEEPDIRGAYSYPLPGMGNAREIASQNIEGKVFFAGEAMHTGGHFGTVHGAMETGLNCVNDILMVK